MLRAHRAWAHRVLRPGCHAALLALGWVAAGPAPAARAETYLVRDGKPLAEIILAEQPARMAKLAAGELQEYIRRISGATLPITTTPTAGCPVQVFVGRSRHTDRLNVSPEGLDSDAFRLVSGENWLALLGLDQDFVPREPYGRSHADRPRVLKEWDAITGEAWDNPFAVLFKSYHPELGLWEGDGRGSLNAVYEFLRRLGVRWYLPGPLGEIVPEADSIPLPTVDAVVRPDFAVRHLYFYYHQFFLASKEEVLWQLRLGLNLGQERLGLGPPGHGTLAVHCRDEVKQAHPEYFALWGGKRAVDHMGGGAPCLSSEGLFQANVRYVRALYDVYGQPMVSVAPADGYVTLCQCDLCKGKGTPERGWHGQLSDYVWGYVDRVARELYKTHPDRKVNCIAYGAYLLPPDRIATLSPNLAVTICRWRSGFHDPAVREQYAQWTKAWREKLPSRELYVWDYYLHSRPGGATEGVPVYFPHAIAEDLRSLRRVSGGDFIEVYRNWKPDKLPWEALAANHLNVYVTSRLYWDAQRDVDALLEEYYTLFYGPAASSVRALVEFSEANWMKATKDVAVVDRMLELVAAARAAAGDTLYGQRVDLLVDYTRPLQQLRNRLVKGRQDVPEARALERNRADLTLDGKLDDRFWDGLPAYALSELETGRPPAFGTSFRAGWAGGALYIGIRCDERDTTELTIGSRTAEDANIWNGDTVELLIETQAHSYYQIAINPAGAMVDADRKAGIETLWSSQAQAAAHVGEGFWSLEVRLPVAGDDAETLDLRNGIAGRRPSETYPWFINVCRQRVRANGNELSAFSPTGQKHFHDLLKFGKLYVR